MLNEHNKKLFISFSFSSTTDFALIGKGDHRVENQPIAIEEAITIPSQGILRQNENGFIYLDVPNEFITAVIPLLDHEGLLRARPTASRSMGAHISVFHEKENITPEELGSVFSKQMPSAPENWEAVEHLSAFNFSDEPTEGLFTEGDFVTVEHSEILATAAKVDAVGQLKLKGNGYFLSSKTPQNFHCLFFWEKSQKPHYPTVT